MQKQKVRSDSPGEFMVLWTNSDGGAVRLSNFGIGKHDLKPEHKAALSIYVVPVLAAGGSALVMGLTSRSGSTFINQKLSVRRAAAVIGQLQRQLGFIPVIAQEHCAGEAAATLAGSPDGQEHPNWRASIVIYSKQKTPPKRPPHIPRVPTMVIQILRKRASIFPGHKSRGPQKKEVEIWSHGSLKARVMTARAMQIYEEPGAYLLMSAGGSHRYRRATGCCIPQGAVR